MGRRGDETLAKRLERLRRERGGVAANARATGETRPRPADNDDIERRKSVVGLERARAARVRPERDISLASEVDAQARLVRLVSRGAAGVSTAWTEVLAQSGLAPEVAQRVRAKRFSRGVLTLTAADAGTKYLVDRFLRSGGEIKVARLSPRTVKKVKVVLEG